MSKFIKEEQTWIDFYNQIADGKIPYSDMCHLDYETPVGENKKFKRITPVQATIQRAKAKIKRKNNI